MDIIEIILGIILGFIIVSSILKTIGESNFNEPKEKLTTKEVMKKLNKLEKSSCKNQNDKLLWFGLGALMGTNLFN